MGKGGLKHFRCLEACNLVTATAVRKEHRKLRKKGVRVWKKTTVLFVDCGLMCCMTLCFLFGGYLRSGGVPPNSSETLLITYKTMNTTFCMNLQK
jgi:hypothetical protein